MRRAARAAPRIRGGAGRAYRREVAGAPVRRVHRRRKPRTGAGCVDSVRPLDHAADPAQTLRYAFLYPVQAITRKSFGDITRKLSVTVLRYLVQFRGTLSRRKSRVASANSLQVP